MILIKPKRKDKRRRKIDRKFIIKTFLFFKNNWILIFFSCIECLSWLSCWKEECILLVTFNSFKSLFVILFSRSFSFGCGLGLFMYPFFTRMSQVWSLLYLYHHMYTHFTHFDKELLYLSRYINHNGSRIWWKSYFCLNSYGRMKIRGEKKKRVCVWNWNWEIRKRGIVSWNSKCLSNDSFGQYGSKQWRKEKVIVASK